MLFPENIDTTTGLTMLQPGIDQQQPESIAQQPVLTDPGPGSNEQNGELGVRKKEERKQRSKEASGKNNLCKSV